MVAGPYLDSYLIIHTFTKLGAQITKSVLGDVCLSCWNGFAAHETEQANELAGKLSGHAPGQRLTSVQPNERFSLTSGDIGSGSTLSSSGPGLGFCGKSPVLLEQTGTGEILVAALFHK